eukprot:TRINITY_DN7883_c0_g1_i1.p1 TRINITY_DN7883_c0_g1~~TRINITY_DN7883_c0_g1_i1.p1  ORF type:complete len:243 (-),score=52.31 TRINITY_DN7883_c0_g1_i1:65-793(-)
MRKVLRKGGSVLSSTRASNGVRFASSSSSSAASSSVQNAANQTPSTQSQDSAQQANARLWRRRGWRPKGSLGGWHETLRLQATLEEREIRYMTTIARKWNEFKGAIITKRLRKEGWPADFDWLKCSLADIAATGKTPWYFDFRKSTTQYLVEKGYKMGLMDEDYINWGFRDIMPEVRARRLPSDLSSYSEMRKKRALVIDTKNKLLPQEEWSQVHEDVPHLLPYMHEAMEEAAERDLFYYDK